MQLSTGYVIGDEGDIAHFEGIPFAAPPVGNLRWRKPQPAASWGVLDCTTGRPFHERRAWPVQGLDENWKKKGAFVAEDCLHACVWAPRNSISAACAVGSSAGSAAGQQLPVLVWIYGGALLEGSCYDHSYSGEAYAERGVIFVSFNYRVGALGFLAPPGADTNCGFWDQVTLLRWVQKEISNFGGDPGNVTIMGQSAGADSVYWLCCSPATRGLFQRAVIMSPSTFALKRSQASELADDFAAVAGVPTAELHGLPWEDILAAQGAMRFSLSPSAGPGWRVMQYGLQESGPRPGGSPAGLLRLPGNGPFPFPAVVIDGEYLIEQPLDALVHGAASELDIMIGSNRDEDAWLPKSPSELQVPAAGSFGVLIQGGMTELYRRLEWEIAGMPGVLDYTEQQLHALVEDLLHSYDSELQEHRRTFSNVEHTKNAVCAVTPCGSRSREQWLFDRISSDLAFVACTNLVAERMARPGGSRRVFRYQFNGYSGKGDAFHGRELQLVLGPESCHEQVRDVRRQWIDTLVDFVSSGDPNARCPDRQWRPLGVSSRPALFWDGELGWTLDAEETLAKRAGLRKLGALYEELWHLAR